MAARWLALVGSRVHFRRSRAARHWSGDMREQWQGLGYLLTAHLCSISSNQKGRNDKTMTAVNFGAVFASAGRLALLLTRTGCCLLQRLAVFRG